MTDIDACEWLPTRTLATTLGVGGLVLLVLAPACIERFDPSWRVESYRILGIKSDPIELKPGDFAELSVLDYKPEGTTVSYEWSWCPVEPNADDRYRCPLRETEGADAGTDASMGGPDAGGGGGGIDPSILELGSGPSVFFRYPGTEESVLQLCRQIQQAIVEANQENPTGDLPTRNCADGYEVTIRLEAETEEGTTRIAKKKVVLWTGKDAVNQNPVHSGIALRISKPGDIPKARNALDWVPPKSRDRDDQWYRLPADKPTPILAGIPYDIRAEVPPANVERYRPPPPRGSDREKGEEQLERLTFRWYVSEGDLDDASGIHIPGESEYGPVRTSGFTLGELPNNSCRDGPSSLSSDLKRGPCDVFLWSVVRDNRNGLNWSEQRLRVVGLVEGGDN